MPCEDLFDWWTLRCGVWIVFLLALLGNGTVVVVLIFARSKMDVPRFLVTNLAFADFFMGLYLGECPACLARLSLSPPLTSTRFNPPTAMLLPLLALVI